MRARRRWALCQAAQVGRQVSSFCGGGIKTSVIASLLATSLSLSAIAYDQPEVKFFVERAEGKRIVECPVMVGALGDRLETVLTNGVKVTARAAPLDGDNRSSISIKIYSAAGQMIQEKSYVAKLAQQKPSFQFGGVTVLVVSDTLLKTTRNSPSWREFDARTKPKNALERTYSQQGCAPLLGAAQVDR